MNRGATLLEAGEVALVGAGPGDPELLTLRALRLIEQADIVVYDRLVSEDVMAFVPASAERRYVGKQVGCHALQQPEINALLVELAKNGKRVVRLKGGDPFVFGRGGEEVEALLAAGVPCRVVPGITSAAACTTYAGIPLTHRGFAQSVSFVTGHLKNDELQLEWDALARDGQTLVFYMGLFNAETISKKLQEHGMSPAMPVALIERGTTPAQRSHITTLDSLPRAVEENGFRPPTLIVVGQVVTLFPQHAAGYGSFRV